MDLKEAEASAENPPVEAFDRLLDAVAEFQFAVVKWPKASVKERDALVRTLSAERLKVKASVGM